MLKRLGRRAGDPKTTPSGASAEDLEVVRRILDGDESAFMDLVERYHATMIRTAMMWVSSRAMAEDVAQETWLAVLEGLPRFEGRSSLKTWIFRILMNRAITRGTRERRSVPFSALADPERDREPAVEAGRFRGRGDERPGHWAAPPVPWDEIPEQRLLAGETLAFVRGAIATLPPSQQEVITLRDVDGWSSSEVCNLLGISETNQRVLLHRARSKVRKALEVYLAGDAPDRGGPAASRREGDGSG